MSNYPRLMLAAGSSGSGKTMITCGILQCLKNRGKRVSSFKCGPDYIDPMFHENVLKTPSANLDTFFTDEETTRYLFTENAAGTELSVIEGVMGYYDGLGGISERASAYDLAKVTDTPVVLIVDTKGMSLSVAAYIKGFLTYREDSRIAGVILNRMSPMLYPEIKKQIEEELGIHVYGYVPRITEFTLESRHLGLVLPGEVEALEKKLQGLAGILEKSLEIDGLLTLAGQAKALTSVMPKAVREVLESERAERIRRLAPIVAVARDEAFCFIYKDNLRLLQALGARLIEFSPIRDQSVPQEAQGLLLYGGYPELYAKELSENVSMRTHIRGQLRRGLPCMAECGGFMYLHDAIEDMEKRLWPMVGVIEGRAFYTGKLSRFGYIELEHEDLKVRGHEFHYFDSDSCGDAFLAKKPLRSRSWQCIHKTKTMQVGFPHLYYYTNPEMALRFLEQCALYGEKESVGS
ncbi:MAG: cobyrinate a,c-diamide synthase [Eubacteriales bacterium]|nr:cobyrinate a,c-diamide synthase [Eubacteriales bacterium]